MEPGEDEDFDGPWIRVDKIKLRVARDSTSSYRTHTFNVSDLIFVQAEGGAYFLVEIKKRPQKVARKSTTKTAKKRAAKKALKVSVKKVPRRPLKAAAKRPAHKGYKAPAKKVAAKKSSRSKASPKKRTSRTSALPAKKVQ